MQVLDHDQERADDHEREDPQHEHGELRLGGEHEGKKDEWHRDEGGEAAAHEHRVAQLEAGGAGQEGLAVVVGVHDGLDDGGQAELALHAGALGDHHVGLAELAVKEVVDVQQVPARRHADEQRGDEVDKKDEQVLRVVVAIEARDRLAHGVDAVGEGQPGVERLEEARLHLDRVEARGAGDLQHDKKDAERLADVLEGDRERVDEEDVHEALDHAGKDERGGRDALDAERDVAHAADDCLDLAEQVEQQPAAKEALPGLEVADAFAVDLELVDGHEHEAADPQGEVRVEGRHAAAVVLDGVDGHGDELGGRAEEVADVLGVEVEDVLDAVEVLGGLDGCDVGRDGRDLVGGAAHGVGGRRERG